MGVDDKISISSNDFRYYEDSSVALLITNGVETALDNTVIMWLFGLAFVHAEDMKEQRLQADYIIVFDIKSEVHSNRAIRYNVKLLQEQPNYVSEHKMVFIGSDCKLFNGRIYLIEAWNGEHTKDINKHNITMLLPEEY